MNELDPQATNSKPGRLMSLDVMRGLTMMTMILVNNPGSWSYVYPPLEHAEWHGWTPTDLVFPLFLFMVGISMAFSLDKRREAGQRQELVVHIVRRAVILFFLGWVLGIFPDVLWDIRTVMTSRFPGVLQRIAICYLLGSLIVLFVPRRVQWWIPFALMAIYLIGMFGYPAPGYGSGSWDVQRNFCLYLDSQFLYGHTWSGAPVAGFDPEGLWSTLPAVASVLFGCFVGRALRPLATSALATSVSPNADEAMATPGTSSAWHVMVRIFVVANVMLLMAYGLSGIVPINKQLWTPSFVFLTTGIAMHVIGVLYYWIDVRGMRRGTLPFVILGENAIFAYCLSSIVGDLLSLHFKETSSRRWLFTEVFEPVFGSLNGSLAMAILFVIGCLGVTAVLHHKRWLLRI